MRRTASGSIRMAFTSLCASSFAICHAVRCAVSSVACGTGSPHPSSGSE